MTKSQIHIWPFLIKSTIKLKINEESKSSFTLLNHTLSFSEKQKKNSKRKKIFFYKQWNAESAIPLLHKERPL